MYIGNQEITKMYIGSDEVDKVYLGSSVIYESTSTHYISGTTTANAVSLRINLEMEQATVSNGTFELTYSGDITTISAMCKSNTSITSVDLTGINYQYIDKEAFQYCSNLSAVTIPEGITVLSGGSFGACYALVDVHLPSTVTAIGNNVFNNASGLTAITIDAATPPTLGTGTFDNTNNCPIYVPCNCLYDYQTASSWASYVSRLDEQPCPDAPLNNEFAVKVNGVWHEYDGNFDQSPYSSDVFIEDLANVMNDVDGFNPDDVEELAIGNNLYVINLDGGGINGWYNCTGITISSSVTESTDLHKFSSLEWIKCVGSTPFTWGGYFCFSCTNGCPIYVPSAALSDYQTEWESVGNDECTCWECVDYDPDTGECIECHDECIEWDDNTGDCIAWNTPCNDCNLLERLSGY